MGFETSSLRGHARFFRNVLLCGAALLPAAPALAADEVAEDAPEGIQSSNEIVVQAEIGYRNRVDEAEPVLVYGE